jgi:hypothetical protein
MINSRWFHDGKITVTLSSNRKDKNMGRYHLKSKDPQLGMKAGEAIIALSNSVNKPNSEWSKFNADPKKWIYEHDYRYYNNDGTMYKKAGWAHPDGYTPDELKLVPIIDTETTMHVRIPFHTNLEVPAGTKIENDDYHNKFPVLLSNYFMRSCR